MIQLSAVAELTEALSVAGSLAACMYQLYLGYMFEGADGFSPVLLCCWIVGDVCNVLGTFWARQLFFQRVIAIVSLGNSFAMGAQHLYYERKHRRAANLPEPVRVRGGNFLAMRWSALLRPYILFTLVSAARAEPGQFLREHEELSDWRYLAGQCMAWAAELSYAFALVPQALENFYRKHTGSVSIAIFVADALGSLSYLASILLTAGERQQRWEVVEFLLEEMPYVFGTAVCALLDCVLLSQYFRYPQFIAEVKLDDDPAALAPARSTRTLQPFRSWKSYGTIVQPGDRP